MNRIRSGFTLIELLIVVAIIAILAAIAVPNFLEAQTRAKVSRVKTDIRTIAVAWDSYRVDWDSYPFDQDNYTNSVTESGFRQVTTPVAYLSSVPSDPFFNKYMLARDDHYAPHYEVASACAWKEPYDCYCMQSIGPDQDDDFSGNDNWPNGGNVRPYDPTNGTVSLGDIYRFGGQYFAGQWNVFGIPYQEWGNIGN